MKAHELIGAITPFVSQAQILLAIKEYCLGVYLINLKDLFTNIDTNLIVILGRC